eukprot:m.49365 g.49365  ORF g.49365 m.49365 type:complete len:531 (+) comp10614_c0_seq1:219-1811(+)
MALKELAQTPERFLAQEDSLTKRLTLGLRKQFSITLQTLPRNTSQLDELLTEGFDSEQVWGQIDIINESAFEQLDQACEALLVAEKKKNFVDTEDDTEDEVTIDNQDGPEDTESEDSDESSEQHELEYPKANQKNLAKTTKKKHPADDNFFKVDEMEAFLQAEDQKELKKSRKQSTDEEDMEQEATVDLFQDIPVEEESMDARDLKYDDFYGGDEDGSKSKSKRRRLSDGDESDSEDEEEQESTIEATIDGNDKDLLQEDSEEEAEDLSHLSKYEREKKNIKHKITKLEEFNISEKPWQLSGEVRSSARAMDSLLQEGLDFDVMTNPAPDITEETTKSLEEKIKQRIIDEAFDDVEHKEDPKNMQAYKPRDDNDLNSEKSKLGLGELYEQQYLNATTSQKTTEAEEKQHSEHEEIKILMMELSTKLNALSNCHYTPPAVQAEIEVVTKVPALSLEEATPAAASKAELLAPEEIHDKKDKGIPMTDSEKSSTDKKRERRAKKKKKHFQRVERETKEKEKKKSKPKEKPVIF